MATKLKLLLFLAISLDVYTSCSQAASLNDTKTLLANLLADYNTNVRPISNQDNAVNVSVQGLVKSIQEFDEVREMISFVGALMLTWNDVNMQWMPADYGNISEITVNIQDVWAPDVVLSSPSESLDTLGKKWNRIRYYSNGRAVWIPADLIKSTCSVDVEKYPFDTQSCVTSFISLASTSSEIIFITMSSDVDLKMYEGNALWNIEKAIISTGVTGGGPQINISITLKRKPNFVIINLLLPILFLSLLNVLVFLLVPESGERVSYCITVLLAIVVFMTIVSDMLPRSSEPIPLISYKLMLDMVSSSAIVLVTILNLQTYHKDETKPIPGWLVNVYLFLSCRVCYKKKRCSTGNNKVRECFVTNDENTNEIVKEKLTTKDKRGTKQTIDVPIVDDLNDEIDSENNVDWKMISFMFDYIFLIFYTLLSAFSFTVFIVVTA